MLEIRSLPEFDNHKLIIHLNDAFSGLRGWIAIHQGSRSLPAFGATRLWKYRSETEAIKDVLHLSKIMSYKAVLAGLPYGGAKGVIFDGPRKSFDKVSLLKSYAREIDLLRGLFITGSDIGLTHGDVEIMARITPFIVGVAVDPTKFTGLGLFYALEVCLREIFGRNSAVSARFAIAGLGKIGFEFLKLICDRAICKEVFVSDIDKEKIKIAKRRYPMIKIVDPVEIHKQKVDVFSPCALGGSLNRQSIKELRCKIILGGANNQLENNTAGDLLYKLGILYAPDYVVNAGGLISVVSEFEGRINEKKIEQRVSKIQTTLESIFIKSNRTNLAPNLVADQMAERMLKKNLLK